MDEALAFTGETGPYLQNGVVRARNILRAKLEADGHGLADLRAARRRARPGRRSSPARKATRSGPCSLLMARSDEVGEQAVRAEEVALLAKHTFAVAQAFHSYYQNPALLRAARRERRRAPARAPRGRPVRARRWNGSSSVLGIPMPERM